MCPTEEQKANNGLIWMILLRVPPPACVVYGMRVAKDQGKLRLTRRPRFLWRLKPLMLVALKGMARTTYRATPEWFLYLDQSVRIA
jgi:hypothetical protein